MHLVSFGHAARPAASWSAVGWHYRAAAAAAWGGEWRRAQVARRGTRGRRRGHSARDREAEHTGARRTRIQVGQARDCVPSARAGEQASTSRMRHPPGPARPRATAAPTTAPLQNCARKRGPAQRRGEPAIGEGHRRAQQTAGKARLAQMGAKNYRDAETSFHLWITTSGSGQGEADEATSGGQVAAATQSSLPNQEASKGIEHKRGIDDAPKKKCELAQGRMRRGGA